MKTSVKQATIKNYFSFYCSSFAPSIPHFTGSSSSTTRKSLWKWIAIVKTNLNDDKSGLRSRFQYQWWRYLLRCLRMFAFSSGWTPIYRTTNPKYDSRITVSQTQLPCWTFDWSSWISPSRTLFPSHPLLLRWFPKWFRQNVTINKQKHLKPLCSDIYLNGFLLLIQTFTFMFSFLYKRLCVISSLQEKLFHAIKVNWWGKCIQGKRAMMFSSCFEHALLRPMFSSAAQTQSHTRAEGKLWFSCLAIGSAHKSTI